MISKLKKEIKEFSPWFKITMGVLLIVYVGFWLFTIHLSGVEQAQGMDIRLPAAPKDSIEYVLMSESLVSGHGLSMNGRIETLRGPGYPLFVAIIKTVGRSYFAVTLIQILLVFASAFVIRRIGMIFSGKFVGEIAATFLVLNPVTLVLSLLILTDVLFMFVFLFGVYLAISQTGHKMIWRTFAIAGLFIVAIYVRGMGIFSIPILVAPFLVAKIPFRARLKSILIIIACVIISIIPWVIRNYVETGVAGFSSFEAVQLAWAVPKFWAYTNGTTETVETKNMQVATGVPVDEWYSRGVYDIKYSKQINAVGEKAILSHPFSYAKWHIITSVPFLFPSTILFVRDAYDSAINYKRPFQYGAINALAASRRTTLKSTT